MPELLTSDDFAEIRSAINDVCDTFLKKPVVYKMDNNTVTRWQRDIEASRAFADINLLGLVVWKKDGKLAQNTPSVQGSVDESEGYVLFGLDALVTAGILTSGFDFNGSTPEDKINFDGKDYVITGMTKVGQLDTVECVVKFSIKTLMRNE